MEDIIRERIITKANGSADGASKQIASMVLLNIGFAAGEVDHYPSAPVILTIQSDDIKWMSAPRIYHVLNDVTEDLTDAETTVINIQEGTVTFVANGFSPFAVADLADEGSAGAEEGPVEVPAEQVTVTAADDAIIRQAAEALGLQNTAAGEAEAESAASTEALPAPGRRTRKIAKPEALPAAEENAPATKSGYVGLDISVDESVLSEGAQYKVPVKLPEPINLTGAENTVIDSLTVKAYHIVDGAAQEVKCVCPDDVKETGILSELTILTDGFSPYLVSYTVEFHNGDKEVVIDGGSQILLSTLITELGLTREDGSSFTVDDVAGVEFITEGLFNVEEVAGGSKVTLNRGTEQKQTVTVSTEHDFVLTSQKPFDEVEMKLTFKDGTTLEVHVTDAQTTGTLTFYEKDGTKVDTAASVGDNYYIAVGNGNDIRGVARVNPVNGIASLNFGEDVDLNGCTFTLVKYTGSDELKPAYASNNWWYDPNEALTKHSDFGLYSFDSSAGPTAFKAVKKDVYKVSINFVNHDQTGPVTPGQGDAQAISEKSWIKAELKDNDKTPVGYAIIKTPSLNSSTNTIIIESFKKIDGGPDITYKAALEDGYTVSDVRLAHSSTDISINNLADYNEKLTNRDITEGDYDGYTFVSNQLEPGSEDSRIITIRQADPTDYYVRLDCGDKKLELPNDTKLYVKTTISFATGATWYGFAEVKEENRDQNNENVFNIPITKWYSSDGNTYENVIISGHERNMSTALYASASEVTEPDSLTQAMIVGSAVQTHKIEKNPSINKDYEPEADKPSRIKVEAPGRVTIYDVIYLSPVTDKLTDTSLENLLSKYNVITLCPNDPNPDTQKWSDGNTWGDGDFMDGNHTIGGVLVRGDLIGYGSFTNIGSGVSATSPSAVGGLLPDAAFQIIGGGQASQKNLDFYVGDSNTVAGGGEQDNPKDYYINGAEKNYNTYGVTVVNNDFVNWDALQSFVISQSEAMLAASNRTIDVANGDTVVVMAGERVTLNYTGDGTGVRVIITRDPTTVPEWDTAPGTVISIANSGTAKIPLLELSDNADGSQSYEPQSSTGDKENAGGLSAVFNFPNATNVSLANSSTEYGHVIAPRAFLTMDFQYNGSLLANAVKTSGQAEGHMWPYRGGNLVPSEAGIVVYKTVGGQEPAEDQVYTFKLDELKDGAWDTIQTKQNVKSVITFDKIIYAAEATHWYLLSEDPDSVTGGIPDSTWYVLKVEVTAETIGTDTAYQQVTTAYKVTDKDNLLVNGNVNAEVITEVTGQTSGDPGKIIFNNTYGSLTIKKTFAGNTDKLTDADKAKISFTVSGPQWDEPQPLAYTAMDNGTYTYHNVKLGDYTVTENTGTGKTYTTTYKVGSDGTAVAGTTASVTVGTSETIVEFTNTYQEVEVRLDAEKKIDAATGVTVPAKKFDFVLAADPEASAIPMPTDTTASITGKGKVSEGENPDGFGAITYTKAGIYYYTITETTESGNGWTCDNTPVKVTVTVTEDSDTKALSASVAYFKGTTAAEITNSYTETSETGNLTIKKTFAGNTDKLTKEDKEKITFTVIGPQWTTAQPLAYKDMENGTHTYRNIKLGDYTVTENTGTGKTYTTTYKVGSDGTAVAGTTASVTVGTSETIVEFTNTYQEVEVRLDAEKKIDAATGVTVPAKKFDFVLAADPEASAIPMPTDTTASITGKGKVSEGENPDGFGAITYTKAGIYYYTITETTESGNGWTCDNTPVKVTVTVTEDSDTKALSASVAYFKGTTAAEITNSYTETSETGNLTIKKTFAGNTDKITAADKAKISFTVSGPEWTSDQTLAYKDMENGTHTYENIKLGEYTVTESTGTGKTYTTTYKVGSDGTAVTGTTASVTVGTSETIVEFINTFQEVKVTLDAEKKINAATGVTVPAKKFDFVLAAAPGEGQGPSDIPMPADTTASITGKGKVSDWEDPFGEITYTKAGTYRYTITETTDSGDGWTCNINGDVTATVNVTEDPATKALSASVAYSKGTTAAEITNKYDVGNLTIKKTFAGSLDKITAADKAKISFTVSGPEWATAQTLAYTAMDQDTGTYTYSNIKLGDYTVTENTGDGKTYTTTYKVGSDGTAVRQQACP